MFGERIQPQKTGADSRSEDSFQNRNDNDPTLFGSSLLLEPQQNHKRAETDRQR